MAKCYTFFFHLLTYEKNRNKCPFCDIFLIKNEKKMARKFDICVFFCFFAFENY